MPAPRPVPDDLRTRPFTRADAVAAGVSPAMLRGSRFRRLFRGVFRYAGLDDTPLLRLDGAALLLPPKTAASHLSAAAVYGLPVPSFETVHVVVRRGWLESRIAGVQVHEARRPRHVVDHAGRRVVAPPRTFVDLADLLVLVDLVIVGDAMVRLGLCSPDDLVDAARIARTDRVQLARRADALVRPRVDSPMETRIRLLLVLGGLPEPETNRDVHNADGVWLARPDLRYVEVRIAIEYDSRRHREDDAQWAHDIGRKERLDGHGWRVS